MHYRNTVLSIYTDQSSIQHLSFNQPFNQQRFSTFKDGLYNHKGELFSSNFAGWNSPIDFKLGIIIPLTTMYKIFYFCLCLFARLLIC